MRQPNAPPDWPEKFLAAYRKNGNISQSAKLARVNRSTVRLYQNADPDFASQMDDAREEAGDALEQEAWRRAKTGTLKPVFQGGKEVGQVREYSDTLLIFMLKGLRPEKFRERVSSETSFGNGSQPQTIRVEYVDSPPPDTSQEPEGD